MKTLKLTESTGYILIQIDHGKVNAIDTAMIEELNSVWEDAEKRPQNPGIILCGRPHCFSAGLDLYHQFSLDHDGIRHFWRMYHILIRRMLRFPAPIVCGITGYAPAGATILSLCCDQRIMGRGEKHRIGMHEFVMSLQIPRILADIYATTIGHSRAWNAVLNQQLFHADEAVSAGLVHEACEVEDVIPRAIQCMESYLQVDPDVFSRTKAFLNKHLISTVQYSDETLEDLLDELMATTVGDKAGGAVMNYLAGIKTK